MTVWRFPRILVIHLKRFKNISYSRREKLNTSINIPLTLDTKPYASHASKITQSLCSIGNPAKNAAQYELYGISHHSGSLYGGHYIA